ncbi:MAG: carboxylate--amine ligase, partial [Actinobacteria bacterium]|nr:carboxylate--amine ligase [Actinomycetota bacterium]
LDAQIIVDADGGQEQLRDSLRRLVQDLAPVAEQLECTAELAEVTRLLTRGTSAERQLAVYEANGGGEIGLRAVVDSLVDEFRGGLA